MNGVKMSSCKFYVNEQERVVICVIPHTKNMLKQFVMEHFQWDDIDLAFSPNWHFNNKLAMPSSFMGKAVCSPDDEWNEALGRKIAFSRAQDKCSKSFFKRANLLVQTIDRRLGDMITTFNDFGLKLDKKREALENDIESVIKKEGDA